MTRFKFPSRGSRYVNMMSRSMRYNHVHLMEEHEWNYRFSQWGSVSLLHWHLWGWEPGHWLSGSVRLAFRGRIWVAGSRGYYKGVQWRTSDSGWRKDSFRMLNHYLRTDNQKTSLQQTFLLVYYWPPSTRYALRKNQPSSFPHHVHEWQALAIRSVSCINIITWSQNIAAIVVWERLQKQSSMWCAMQT